MRVRGDDGDDGLFLRRLLCFLRFPKIERPALPLLFPRPELLLRGFGGSFFLGYLLARTSTLLRRRFLSAFFASRRAGARTTLRFFFTFLLGHTWRCRKSRFLECRSLEKQGCCWRFRHGLFFHNVSMLTELALLGLYLHAFKRKSLRSRMRRPQACAFS